MEKKRKKNKQGENHITGKVITTLKKNGIKKRDILNSTRGEITRMQGMIKTKILRMNKINRKLNSEFS